ncbi:Hypothetical protein UVM_LOCUS504 [uncultured virus]|nr:Hypothetical protein UVM_LOCUS504 [uncultured virus]
MVKAHGPPHRSQQDETEAGDNEQFADTTGSDHANMIVEEDESASSDRDRCDKRPSAIGCTAEGDGAAGCSRGDLGKRRKSKQPVGVTTMANCRHPPCNQPCGAEQHKQLTQIAELLAKGGFRLAFALFFSLDESCQVPLACWANLFSAPLFDRSDATLPMTDLGRNRNDVPSDILRRKHAIRAMLCDLLPIRLRVAAAMVCWSRVRHAPCSPAEGRRAHALLVHRVLRSILKYEASGYCELDARRSPGELRQFATACVNPTGAVLLEHACDGYELDADGEVLFAGDEVDTCSSNLPGIADARWLALRLAEAGPNNAERFMRSLGIAFAGTPPTPPTPPTTSLLVDVGSGCCSTTASATDSDDSAVIRFQRLQRALATDSDEFTAIRFRRLLRAVSRQPKTRVTGIGVGTCCMRWLQVQCFERKLTPSRDPRTFSVAELCTICEENEGACAAEPCCGFLRGQRARWVGLCGLATFLAPTGLAGEDAVAAVRLVESEDVASVVFPLLRLQGDALTAARCLYWCVRRAKPNVAHLLLCSRGAWNDTAGLPALAATFALLAVNSLYVPRQVAVLACALDRALRPSETSVSSVLAATVRWDDLLHAASDLGTSDAHQVLLAWRALELLRNGWGNGCVGLCPVAGEPAASRCLAWQARQMESLTDASAGGTCCQRPRRKPTTDADTSVPTPLPQTPRTQTPTTQTLVADCLSWRPGDLLEMRATQAENYVLSPRALASGCGVLQLCLIRVSSVTTRADGGHSLRASVVSRCCTGCPSNERAYDRLPQHGTVYIGCRAQPYQRGASKLRRRVWSAGRDGQLRRVALRPCSGRPEAAVVATLAALCFRRIVILRDSFAPPPSVAAALAHYPHEYAPAPDPLDREARFVPFPRPFMLDDYQSPDANYYRYRPPVPPDQVGDGVPSCDKDYDDDMLSNARLRSPRWCNNGSPWDCLAALSFRTHVVAPDVLELRMGESVVRRWRMPHDPNANHPAAYVCVPYRLPIEQP